jgi:hypothetical protein
LIDGKSFYTFARVSKFLFRLDEWGELVHYILLFLKISGRKVVSNYCFEVPQFEQILPKFLNNFLILY